MIPVMNGHNHAPAPSLPLPEPLRQRPGLSLLLAAIFGAAATHCGPVLERAAAQLAPKCPDPAVRTVAKSCDPPCKPNEVCSSGTCVNVASERNMTLASDHDPLPRVILRRADAVAGVASGGGFVPMPAMWAVRGAGLASVPSGPVAG